ncbi:tyrosine-type recombinase/integrase [Caenispirillum salinarum]|uniref:tyrosine-type recombinase/integrase n=1 Tax=Caenispirillum salinarum TaxID=859058 RepID=UPI00384F53AE
MAKQVDRLTARAVATTNKPGRYADGRGLYLHVAKTGAKSWVLRYRLSGKSREMGLGAVADVGLQDARRKAADARGLLADGVDPLDAREAERLAAAVEAAKAITFKDAAERYIAAHRPTWKNAKHASQWENTLRDYVHPVFGAVPVADVDTGLVLKAVEPIWHTKPETASRVRQRIEAVLDWARARGYRDGPNPALWRGHLSHTLPARARVAKVEHHAALPYAEVAAFLADLRGRDALAARALEFVILTASRTGEALGATWAEVDLAAAVWTVPGDRMKAKRDHRVPLSPQAVAVLEAMGEAYGRDGYVFPGQRKGKPLSYMGLLMLLRRMNPEGECGGFRWADDKGRAITVHGFRSSFRDWTAEQTAFPGEVAEAALAHVVGDKVEAAYRRGDLFEKRRRLMEAWADYCDRPAAAGNVVPINRAG